MIKLSNAIDKIIFNMTVKAMLDPNNEYFYIPRLTLEKVEVLCDNDDDKTEMFWLCFNYAYNQYCVEQLENECLLESQHAYELQHTCPECHCQNYIQGCRCPNCDYIE